MESLSCPICFHDFNSIHQVPLILHCGHTLCSSCIQSSERRMGALHCPLCRGLDYREMSIMKRNIIVCQYLTNTNAGPTVPCSGHPGFESIFFCLTDNSPFCLKCVTMHKFHDFYNIDDEVITLGTDKDLASKVDTAKMNLERSQKEREQVSKFFEIMEVKKNNELENINKSFDGIVDMINNKRKEFISDLNGKFNSVARKIQKVVEECDEVIIRNQKTIQEFNQTKKKIGKLASSARYKAYQETNQIDLSFETKQPEITDLITTLSEVNFKIQINPKEILISLLPLESPTPPNQPDPNFPIQKKFEDSLKLSLCPPSSISESISREQLDLVQQLLDDGIEMSSKIRSILESTDRKLFMPKESRPYEDRPQKIGYSTTISAPHMHAHTLRLLEDYLKPGIKVLDVGSGSGYLTLCLAKMIGSGSVFGLDHIEELINIAIENINNSNPELVNGENISIRMVHGDGRNGLPEFAPFDVIHVGASTPEIPKALINQLAFGGVIIAPVGQISSVQHITVGRKKMDGSMDYANCFNVCYAPLTDREKQCPGS